MKILYKFATRSRRDKAFAAVLNIKEMSVSDNYHILMSCDTDDESMNQPGVREFCQEHGVSLVYGTSKNKIDAINRDMDFINDWDILVNMSDDMVFTVKGFDNIIRNSFGVPRMVGTQPYSFAIDLDQFIHFNDGNQKDNVCTLSIMGKQYYDRFKYIYHPSYQSLWCDVESTEVAYMLGKYKYMGDDIVIFNHVHPAWGLCEWDEQYRKTEDPKYWFEDKEVIYKRRVLNYSLPINELVNTFKYGAL